MNLSPHVFTFPFLLPRVVALLRNWPVYLLHYLGRTGRPARYLLRDGRVLVDEPGTLAGTFAVVFIRREYGVFRDLRTIVDIGANMGTFAVYAAGLCPQARILCVEPEPRNYARLQEHLRMNNLSDRVTALPLAIGGRAGPRRLALRDSPVHSLIAEQSDAQFLEVPCTTLPELLRENGMTQVDLLKINCEGMEYEILETLTAADVAGIDRIRMEYHNLDGGRRNGPAARARLEELGFHIERYSRYRDSSGFIWARREGVP